MAALSQSFPARVEKSRKVSVPRWPRVGQVHLIVRHSPATERVALVAELKWCGPGHDILFEGVWDLFKMALAALRDDAPRAYLLAGAQRSVWRTSSFASLYDSQEHDPVQLCL